MKSRHVLHGLRMSGLTVGLVALSWVGSGLATENVPHAPYAQWAILPDPGQLVVRAFYQESEAYYIWADRTRSKVDYVASNGEHYGIDINQGFLTLQYGITERWAVDLSVGYTTSGWRYFSNFSESGQSQSTTGLMDVSFGVRYQIFDERNAQSPWVPTLTFRAGGVLPGSYDEEFPFAPGTGSAAIEPELLLRKHVGWPGFGVYADGLFRWNRTTANDQYIVSAGFFQQIKGWELSAGWRHLQSITGHDIAFAPDTRYVEYYAGSREINDSIEAGFSYTTPKKHWSYAFYTRTVLDGSNTDKKFWIGGYIEIPFAIVKPK